MVVINHVENCFLSPPCVTIAAYNKQLPAYLAITNNGRAAWPARPRLDMRLFDLSKLMFC